MTQPFPKSQQKQSAVLNEGASPCPLLLKSPFFLRKQIVSFILRFLVYSEARSSKLPLCYWELGTSWNQ